MEQELTLEEAAQYLNISGKTIEILISEQQLSTPITHADLSYLKTQWEKTSLKARTQLAELTRQYNMGY